VPYVVALMLLAAAVLPLGCAGPGQPKAGAPAHHLEHGFRNLNPEYRRPNVWVRWGFFLRRIWATTFHPRAAHLDRVTNDGTALRANRTEPSVTWIGHSTLLIQVDGVNVLTDPQWSSRASPLSFAGPRRITAPGLEFEALPPIDLVLISHDHYDHLDVATVRRLAATHPRFLVPLGLRSWFAELGIDEVEELDWWETRSVLGLAITCVPAQHWSARSWWDENRRLWSGWVLAGRDRRLYFAGDSGYYAPLFREIGERLGPFQLAAIPIGAYQPPAMMRMSHTTPGRRSRHSTTCAGSGWSVSIGARSISPTSRPRSRPCAWSRRPSAGVSRPIGSGSRNRERRGSGERSARRERPERRTARSGQGV
jgi:N-acyl-phosphatidylethanolamine-hydrolysing phospholipase D